MQSCVQLLNCYKNLVIICWYLCILCPIPDCEVGVVSALCILKIETNYNQKINQSAVFVNPQLLTTFSACFCTAMDTSYLNVSLKQTDLLRRGKVSQTV